MKYDVKDLKLAPQGAIKIAWAGKDMPVLQNIARDFKKRKPFKNFNIPVFARKGENNKKYFEHLHAVLDMTPDITMDDGADLAGELHSKRAAQTKKILGGTEETTTGVIRLRALAREGALRFPVIAVN